MNETKNYSQPFLKDFIIAGSAGVITNTLIAPLFNIKLSIDNSNIRLENITKITKLKQGIFYYPLKYIQKEGTINLWKGNSKVIINAFWFQGISFGFKNIIQKFVKQTKLHKEFIHKFFINTFSGVIGGSIALMALYPLDYPRVMVVQMKSIKDFYKNFSFHLIPSAIYRGLYFGIFDSIKRDDDNQQMNSFSTILLYSFLSTLTAQILSSPFQAAKFKIIRQKQLKSINRYFDLLKKESLNAFKECFQFRFPFLYRTCIGALTLTIYQYVSQLSSSY